MLLRMVVYLGLTLKDAVGHIAHLRAHGMPNNALYAVSAERSVGCHGLGKFRYLVAIGREVGGKVVFKAESGGVAVA